jgi:hypothetical protein
MDYNGSRLRIEIVTDWKLFLSVTLAALIRHLLI